MATGDPDPAALRHLMAGQLTRSGVVRSAALAKAFGDVPRHLFLPEVVLATVYSDQVIETKRDERGRAISSSSQPSMMAMMLEQLELRPGQRVLEIGAGTGYNAALMGHVVGPSGSVVTVDIDDDLVEQAGSNLQVAGAGNVTAVRADGAQGWPPGAPYDRIILTAGATDITPAWFEQLAGDGILVGPLALQGTQLSVAFERVADHLESMSILECRFMTMRGELSETARPAAPLGERVRDFLQGRRPDRGIPLGELAIRVHPRAGERPPAPEVGDSVVDTVHSRFLLTRLPREP